MKRVSLLTILALVVSLLLVPAVQAAPPAAAFAGHWEALDPVDDSALDVYISGGGQMRYTDAVASQACEGLDDQAWESFLTGKVDGDQLFTTMRWARCGTGPAGPAGFQITWTLESNGHLTNDFGEDYTRA